jgi:acyl transferase domain-containing protein/NADPH:quinone reductase-like Zn-dependent oxidoreductase/ubiquinone/menaquinone biosynthesis C-methylase UbiE
MIPWPENSIRRASVNSFGYGGTNAHVILESADDYLKRDLTSVKLNNGSETPRPRLFMFSHAHESGLGEAAANLKRFVAHLDRSYRSLDSLAHTLTRRSILDYRFFVTASTQEELIAGLDRQANGEDRVSSHTTPPKICFAFTGQGAQWAGMGRELLLTHPVFAKSMEQSEEMLLRMGAGWHLIEELCKEEDSRINEAALSQPVCTAIQIALVDLLASWNILPVGVVGHSSGEIAAAYAAGMLSAEDGLKAAYRRGQCVQRLKVLHPELRGAMLAAGISAADAQEYLVDEPSIGKAVVACENSPSSVTISGDDMAVSAVQEKLAEKQLFNRKLVVEAAYHSHHMELVQEEYWTSIQDIHCGQRRPAVHMVSSVNGERVQDGALDARYWCKNLTSRVRFVDAVTGMLKVVRGEENGPVVVVEIGPHSALAGPIKQIIKATKFQGVDYVSVLARKQDASATAVTAAGQLFQRGSVGLNFDAINNPHGSAEKRLLSDLPAYSWTHKTQHWSESRRSANYRLRKFPRHDLLGTATSDTISEEPTWRNYLRLQEQPWLVGHTIAGSVIFPAAGYLAMAVEALKQVTLRDSKSWRNMRIRIQKVTFGSALIIPEDSAVETILQLRPHTAKNSWKEFRVFSISSSGESTEHCRGMATAAPQSGRQGDLADADSIKFIEEVSKESQIRIAPRKLYRELRNVGLEYTGLFASQKHMRASQSTSVCCVQIPDAQSTMPAKHQQPHCIHPSTLDLCIQSVFPAMKTAGLLGSSVVVSSINSIEIHSEIPSKPGQELDVMTKLRQYGRSKVTANTMVAHSQRGKSSVFMKINGVVLASSGGPLQPGPSQRPEGETLTHRLKWSIDPRFAEPRTIMNHCQLSQAELTSSGSTRICNEYTRVLIQRTLASLGPQEELKIKGHFSKLLQWMKANSVDANAPVTSIDENLEAKVKAAGAHGESLVHIGPHLAGVLRGEVDALELLRQNDRLYKLYSYENYDRGHRQLAKYTQMLQFKNPNMRILEIGAGTASTTMPILEAMSATADCSEKPKLDRYTFTDISSGFFEKAEHKLERFGDLIEFKKLDIEHSPEQQGFDLGSYDLIIATNVLHATRDIENTLNHVRSLLKPDGHLALMEFTVSSLSTGLIFGMLPGWWLSVDNRHGGPLLSTSRWNESLRKSGFSGVDVELPDYANAEHEMSVLISTPSRESNPSGFITTESPRRFSISSDLTESPDGSRSTMSDLVPQIITPVSSISMDDFYDAQIIQIVHGAAEKPIADQLSMLLGEARIQSKRVDLSNLVPDNQLVVVLLESVDPFLSTCSESEWEKIRQMCQLAAGVLWVTTGAAVESSNPMRSLITGLSRCLRSENHTIKFLTLDLESKSKLETTSEWELNTAGQICNVFQRSLHCHEPEALMEWEYAIRGGEVLIPRLIQDVDMDNYIRDSVSNYHPRHERALKLGRALGLNIQVPGLLDTLYWADSKKHSRPVGSEEVRVELENISLNFKDIMIAMGQLDDHTTLLLEGSGKVIEVGYGLSGQFAVGDSVYVLDFDGLATTSNINKLDVYRIPPKMNLEIPAAVGIAYATALYALRHGGNLQEGESVLIHSGAGAVGQAAITLAQHFFKAGDIFVTVGTDEKREFIKNKFGIPDENIFSSRGLDFHLGVLRQTNGEGVDVVLNSLSGEALQKSVEVLAPLGRFVEIGKKDLISSDARLEMWSLEKNIQFSTVDLTLVRKKRPDQLHEVFRTVFDLLTQNKVATVSPITAKPVSELEEAFRLMQAGKHTGKLLIKLDSQTPIRVSSSSGIQYERALPLA